MTEAEFWDCTPRYFSARQKVYVENQRMLWELARFTGWLSVLPHVSKKHGGLKITDLYRFNWEEKKQILQETDLESMKKFEIEAKLIFEKQFGVSFNTTET